MPERPRFHAWLRAALFLLLAAGGLANGAAAAPDDDLPSLDQIYGQLLIVGFTGTRPDHPGVRRAREDLRRGRVGGLIAFERNIVDAPQLSSLLAHLRGTPSAQPPFLAVDQEGGAVQRLRRLETMHREPSARWVGANLSLREARERYGEMAGAIDKLGFNLNLGPVVDLDFGPGNPVIGRLRRSYGASACAVVRYAGAFVAAHRAHGVLTALKHWPGHGSSLADPHLVVADVTDTWQDRERRPFAALVARGMADMIMTGHVYHRAWGEGDGRPASLSPAAVKVALRQELGFDGVIVTDDIQMAAALDGRSLAETIVLALAAGNDIVLIANILDYQPDVARFGVRVIRQAVADGRLELEDLKRSYRRVVALKQRLRQ